MASKSPILSSYELILHPSENDSHTRSHTMLKGREWWAKASHFIIVIPTAVSLAVGVLHLQHYWDSGMLYNWSASSRTLTQAFIHILSTLLSILWVVPISGVINHWTNHLISKSDVSFNTLRLWSAMTSAKTDWNLPAGNAVLVLGFFGLTYSPATLWVGALTPSITYKLVEHVPIPVPGPGPHGNYSFLRPPSSSVAFAGCFNKQQINGTFTNCPLKYNTGNLLLTVASASTPDGSPRNHSKWDNTKFQFRGRSYGVGASPGLADSQLIDQFANALSYTYDEVGYFTETKCVYNETAYYSLQEKYDSSSDETYPNIYLAVGALPNSNWTGIIANNFSGHDLSYYAQVALYGNSSIVSTFIQTTSEGPEQDQYVGIFAGSAYPQLNKLQCTITLTPSLFHVGVSLLNSTISVERDATGNKTQAIRDFDPSGELYTRAVGNLGLSFVVTSLYVSTVGHSFMANVQNLALYLDDSEDNATYSNNTVQRAVADSITAMVDDNLVALSSTMLTWHDGTNTTEAIVTIDAVEFGSGAFILAVVLINLGGLVAIIVVKVVLWNAHIPLFDYNDLACLAVGIREGARESEEAKGWETGMLRSWNGDPKSSSIGRLRARVDVSQATSTPVVVLT